MKLLSKSMGWLQTLGWGAAQRKRLSILSAGATVCVALDQWTKSIVVSGFFLGESIEAWGNWIKLTLVHNYGVAFGFMNQSSDLQHYLLTTLNIIIVLVLIGFIMWMPLKRLERFAIGLIVSGAIGNIIDRFNYGYVIDFVDVGLEVWRWPVFNIADSCVSVGITIWLVSTLFFYKPPTTGGDGLQ